ncbi:MAG: putative metal-binding motif-containing protein, partial [Alphaproteobacteria bacterium]|nr:putative metal-binding motif-containing protein [Alphaproteobacteria bacterium]
LASGLWVDGGCDGGCRVEHTVLTGLEGRVGGAVVWGGAEGTLSRVTITDNRAGDGGGALILRSGAVAVDHAVVSDPFAAHDTFDVRGGSLFLSDTTVFSTRPGVELAPADVVRPVFLEHPLVPDLCGSGVVPSPVAPGNAPIVAWPEPEGRGALSTDCGPWCVDADGDGSPAMWDCDDADPSRGDDLPEVWSDGIDQDCDGADECLADLDGDGVAGTPVPVGPGCAEVPAVLDCDDADPARFPGAIDTPGDGVDADCDGVDPTAPLPPTDDEVVLARGCATSPGPWWLGLVALLSFSRSASHGRRSGTPPWRPPSGSRRRLHLVRPWRAGGCGPGRPG